MFGALLPVRAPHRTSASAAKAATRSVPVAVPRQVPTSSDGLWSSDSTRGQIRRNDKDVEHASEHAAPHVIGRARRQETERARGSLCRPTELVAAQARPTTGALR